MTFHAGHLIAERVGAELVAAAIGDETAATSTFDYPVAVATTPLEDAMADASAEDVLVSAPAYSPRFLGTRFAGQSVMYVQGVNTYSVIDGFFDHYVACSPFVRDHLRLHYGFDVPVIAPFVHVERIGAPVPFEQRPGGSVGVIIKAPGEIQLELVRQRLAGAHQDVEVTFTTLRGLHHDRLLTTLQGLRYVLTLSAFEGHPLLPLEAMRSGCCVVGFHGRGGLAYMRPGINAAVVGYPRVDEVADLLAGLVRDPRRSETMARMGRDDAAAWGYAPFAASWAAYVDGTLLPRRRVPARAT
jgi:Glycosyl transferases group 1